DGQTVLGKVPCEVARRATRRGIPVIALAASIGAGVSHIFAHGINAFVSILRRPCTLDEAIADAARLVERGAEDALRMVAVGIGLAHARRTACKGAVVEMTRVRQRLAGRLQAPVRAAPASGVPPRHY